MIRNIAIGLADIRTRTKDRYPPFKLHLKGFPAIANDAKSLEWRYITSILKAK